MDDFLGSLNWFSAALKGFETGDAPEIYHALMQAKYYMARDYMKKQGNPLSDPSEESVNRRTFRS